MRPAVHSGRRRAGAPAVGRRRLAAATDGSATAVWSQHGEARILRDDELVGPGRALGPGCFNTVPRGPVVATLCGIDGLRLVDAATGIATPVPGAEHLRLFTAKNDASGESSSSIGSGRRRPRRS